VTARLSPRRRLLFGAAAVVQLVAVVVVVLAVTRGDGATPGDTAVQDEPGPVLLVPGYGGGTGGLEQLARLLRSTGRQATIVALPGDGTGDLDAQAEALGKAADADLAAGAPSVDVVGYSAGGIVARIWARNDGGAVSARRIVTLGSPHHGTDLAAAAGLLVPGECPLACRQLVPGSDVITDLNAGDETPDGPVWVSIWTTQDQVVVPPSTARLVGAHDVAVQQICPGRAVGHGQLPTDAVVDGIVLRALAAAPFVTPTHADCAALAAGR
jgi:triacylglycerol lipase